LEYTPDEIMVVCMARQIRNGEIVVQGLATPLVAAAFLLARHTHAPDLYFASAIGQSVCRYPASISLTHIESLWLEKSMLSVGFVRVVADILPRLKPKEFFRPAQIDPCGNFNNIAFSRDYLVSHHRKPRLRLPGSGGIPDVSVFGDQIYLYVPRHSRITFVPKLDVCSGLGHSQLRKWGQGPHYLVTDLGQFDYCPEDPSAEAHQEHRMRLVSLHRGITIEHVQKHTGFDLVISPGLHETPPPTDQELCLLRETIDPIGIRRLELFSGAERRQLLRDILQREGAA
jgi:acyl CoA:acetate/3-ketoacid CoA transferase beta subunit